jgi:hypothetical protein
MPWRRLIPAFTLLITALVGYAWAEGRDTARAEEPPGIRMRDLRPVTPKPLTDSDAIRLRDAIESGVTTTSPAPELPPHPQLVNPNNGLPVIDRQTASPSSPVPR